MTYHHRILFLYYICITFQSIHAYKTHDDHLTSIVLRVLRFTMADDEFAEVYGSAKADVETKTDYKPTTAIEIDDEDDEALFMQLYGDTLPSDEKDATDVDAGPKDVVLNRTLYTVYLVSYSMI